MRALHAAVGAALLVGCGAATPTLADRAARADTEGKTLVVEFYTDWCKVCRRFRERVWPDTRVQAALSDVRYVRLDAERGGRDAAERLGVVGYPTFVALDARGEPVATVRGLPTVERFVEFLAWSPVRAIDERALRRRLAAGRSKSTLLLAARWHAERGRLDEAVALYDEALAGGPDPDVAWERSQVRAAGGTRRAWAEAAAAYLAAHPRARHSGRALAIALVSGGLEPEPADALASSYLEAVADDAPRLEEAVYVLLAARMPQRAVEAATALVERWPKLHMFREALADARAARSDGERAVAARAWVADRARDLGLE